MTPTDGHPARIGPYPIEREIGRGGMGIVYLGRDTRLERSVAIKVLPPEFAADPERLARFEREARMVAALNHTNVAGIYGLEEADGRRFLALEYVEGDTLAERIARGPLDTTDALEIARQIAAGLEAAHEAGIIHRDLKPGNIKLTPSGDVKILDFGLARAGGGPEAASGSNLSHSPTMTHAGTVAGVILGTAAYMSPEQARGRVVDRRTDIWSFGCVLFECLTGRQAFAGDTVSDMVALILQGTPPWDALPSATPPALRHLLERCLEKDAKKRMRDIGDARLDIEELLSGKAPAAAPTAAPAPRSARPLLFLALFLAASTLGLALFHWMTKPEAEPTLRLSLTSPPGIYMLPNPVGVDVSPDGTRIAFVAADSSGETYIFVRPVGSLASRRIAGTDGVSVCFWSPAGDRIAFFTDDRLKKVNLDGGTPEDICTVNGSGRGAAWSPDGTIVLAPAGEGPLFKVSANGGTPEPLTALDASTGETGHRFPHFLPDGTHFLFAALPPDRGQYTIHVASTRGPDRDSLMVAEGVPVYVEPGYLLYSRNSRLVAQRFDAGKRKLIGEPVSLGDEPGPSDWMGSPSIKASGNVVTYFRNMLPPTELAWLDRSGAKTGIVPAPSGHYNNVALSPDGERAVVSRKESARESDLWIVELASGTTTRFTYGPGRIEGPVWSPDGTRIVFSSDRNGTWDMYVKAVNGASPEEKIPTERSSLTYAAAITPDNRTLLFRQLSEKTNWDLWTIPLDGDNRSQMPYIQTPFVELGACFSPDGRWVCYGSTESGAMELYVQSFPEPGRKYRISNGGGNGPRWSADGREIGYRDGVGRATFVSVQTDGGFSAGRPVSTFNLFQAVDGAPTADLQRFLASIVDENHDLPPEMTVLLNWRGELERK